MPPSKPRRRTDHMHRSRDTLPLSSPQGPAERAQGEVRARDVARELSQATSLLRDLAPRMRALSRALEACNSVERALDEVFAGVPEGERVFTLQLARALGERPEVARKAKIALQQHEVALQHFRDAQEVLAQFKAAGLDRGLVEDFSLSKFRGALHPLYNFCLVFHETPLLSSLFPPLTPPDTRPLGRRLASPRTMPLHDGAEPVQREDYINALLLLVAQLRSVVRARINAVVVRLGPLAKQLLSRHKS